MTVHVFGSPDESMDSDERLCSEELPFAVAVVYHVRPLPTFRGWMCGSCGYLGFVPDAEMPT